MVRLADARRPREGMTLTQFLDEFAPDEVAAEALLVERRWPDGVRCADCDSAHIAEHVNRRPQDRSNDLQYHLTRVQMTTISLSQTANPTFSLCRFRSTPNIASRAQIQELVIPYLFNRFRRIDVDLPIV